MDVVEFDAGQPTRKTAGSRATVAELGLAALFTLYVAWPFLRRGRFVVGFDTVAYSGPNHFYSQQAWRHGHLATWNDQIFGGVPHLGNAQTGVLYPPKFFTLWMGANRGMGLLVAAHLLWLCVGTVLLLRLALRLAPPAAFVGAVALVGSGAVMTKSVQFEQILVLAWAPWLLLAIDGVLRLRTGEGGKRSHRRSVAFLAIVVAMLGTAGHPQILYILVPIALFWTLVRARQRHTLRRVGSLVLGGMLGLLMSLPQLVPLVTATARSALVGGRALQQLENPAYTLAPRSLPQSLLGDMFVRDHAFTAGSFEGVAFVGVAGCVLALMCCVLAARRRVDRMLVGVLVVLGGGSTLLALGSRTFAYRLLYRVVPGFDQARVPARWMIVAVICMAILAAVAVDALVRNTVRRSDGVITASVFGLLLGAVTFVQHHRANAFRVRSSLVWWWIGIAIVVCAAAFGRRSTAAVASDGRSSVRMISLATPALIAAILVGELAVSSSHSFGRRLLRGTPVERAESPVLAFLRSHPERSIALTDDRLGEPDYLVKTLRPNTNVLAGLRSLDGYDGGVQVTRRWVQMVETLRGSPIDPELTLRSQAPIPLNAVLLARYGVRWLVLETASRNPADVAPGWTTRVSDGSVVVLDNPAFVGSVTLRFRAVSTTSSTAATAAVRNTALASDTAVVEGPPNEALDCAEACAPVGIDRVTRLATGHVGVDVNTRHTAILTVDEQTASGWGVRVDGRRRPTLVVDGFNVGVQLEPGRHHVAFTYNEPFLRPAFLIAALAAAAVLVLFAVGDRRLPRLPRCVRVADAYT